MRTVEVVEPRRRRTPSGLSSCSVFGCTVHATNGKPFCIEHLDRLPYAASVSAAATQREREVEDAARGIAPADAAVAQDVHEWLLEHPLAPPGDMAHAIGVSLAVAERFLEALERAGRVERVELPDRNRLGHTVTFYKAIERPETTAAERTAPMPPKRELRKCGCGFETNWPPAFGSHATSCAVARGETKAPEEQSTPPRAKKPTTPRFASEEPSTAVDEPRRTRSVPSAASEGNDEGTATATSSPRTYSSDEEAVAQRVREALPEATKDAETAFGSFARHVRVCRACPGGALHEQELEELCPLGRAFAHRWSRLERAS